jgi:hypothetical protein
MLLVATPAENNRYYFELLERGARLKVPAAADG